MPFSYYTIVYHMLILYHLHTLQYILHGSLLLHLHRRLWELTSSMMIDSIYVKVAFFYLLHSVFADEEKFSRTCSPTAILQTVLYSTSLMEMLLQSTHTLYVEFQQWCIDSCILYKKYKCLYTKYLNHFLI